MENKNIPVLNEKCPICGRKADYNYRPFCSKHCADVDLNRWLSGVYRVETQETPDTVIPEKEDE